MTIELVRIDDRLIHGQIVQGWLKSVSIDRILVVSDEVAVDKMQCVLLSMAVPGSVKLSIKTIKDAAMEIINNVYENEKTMILLSNPQDIVKLIDCGVKFKSINIGGMHFVRGKKQLLQNVSVDENDIKALIKLISLGIELENRALPHDERNDISLIIKKEAEILKLV